MFMTGIYNKNCTFIYFNRRMKRFFFLIRAVLPCRKTICWICTSKWPHVNVSYVTSSENYFSLIIRNKNIRMRLKHNYYDLVIHVASKDQKMVMLKKLSKTQPSKWLRQYLLNVEVRSFPSLNHLPTCIQCWWYQVGTPHLPSALSSPRYNGYWSMTGNRTNDGESSLPPYFTMLLACCNGSHCFSLHNVYIRYKCIYQQRPKLHRKGHEWEPEDKKRYDWKPS